MTRSRFTFDIRFEVDKDLVPGLSHETGSWIEYIRHQLASDIPHYNPTVDISEGNEKE